MRKDLRTHFATVLPAAVLFLTLPFAAHAGHGRNPASSNYMAMGVDASWLNDARFRTGTSGGSVDFDAGWGGLWTFGHRFSDGFRTELELSYDRNDFSLKGGSGLTGAVDTRGLFINGLYDFRTGTLVTPYVGLGLGMLDRDYRLASDTFGGDFIHPRNLHIDGAGTHFSWQALAGLKFNAADDVEILMTTRFRPSR